MNTTGGAGRTGARPAANDLTLTAGPATLVVAPGAGGRMASLQLGDHHVLVVGDELGPLQWGAYPMTPWAGRVRHGRFSFAGRSHRLPLNLPPHSAHGTGFTSAWETVHAYATSIELSLSLTSPWPFAGTVRHRIELEPDRLAATLVVEAEEDMPAMVGWHPWFVRHMVGPDGAAAEAVLDFGRPPMYELDEEAIPTGRLVPCSDGPWDNCFTSPEVEPTIRWPGVLGLRLSSSCDHWVVFTEPEHSLCVEPQTAAPDQFNRDPAVLSAGERMEHRFTISWELPPGGQGERVSRAG